MRRKGKIKSWDDEKGFGFISPNTGEKDVFLHIKSFKNRERRPRENEVISYELKTNAKGQAQAENAMFRGDRVRSVISFARRNISLIFVLAYFSFLGGSTFIGKLPLAILWFYLGVSVVAYIAYALDKSAAKNDKWRTKENTLHLFSLIGGWPGALCAQRLLRHKSRKQPFQFVFWFTVFLNAVLLGLLFTSDGSEMLRSIFGEL